MKATDVNVSGFQSILKRATESWEQEAPQTKEESKRWLSEFYRNEMPELTQEEADTQAELAVTGLERYQTAKVSLEESESKGVSRQGWLQTQFDSVSAQMGKEQFVSYLSEIDRTLDQANQESMKTILTQSGSINQNPNLDGFIAETELVNSYNTNAALQDGAYRARVLQPEVGQTYGKNSVDISVDSMSTGQKGVQRYQAKFGKDSTATADMVLDKDYRNQRILVPKGQGLEVKNKLGKKTVTEYIETADGVKGSALSKAEVKRKQELAQSGKGIEERTWNDYDAKELTKYMGMQIGLASAAGGAMGAGMQVLGDLVNGNDIEADKVMETAIKTGADTGAKTALTAALKVGTEKGVLPNLVGSSTGVLGVVSSILVDNTKVMYELGNGDITAMQAIHKMESNTYSGVGGFLGWATGAEIGATIGSIVPGIGTLIGGIVGAMAGSTVGKIVHKGVTTVRKVAVKAAKATCSAIASVAKAVWSGVKSIAKALNPFNWF
ncbi:hypothetical protein [Veillonella sp. CHU732]|uniref:hypothetical protein n=1 Tax=Veillonella sp. CHU732 TaxID=2490949 RepID=UPI000F8E737F|nr:hypothetical protein [Veillonella sp. CHU732]